VTPLATFVRQRLHRRIFLWFGASILMTALVSALVATLHSPGRAWHASFERLRTFAGRQFAIVWDDPARRAELARAAAEDLGVGLSLEALDGRTLGVYGDPCSHGAVIVPVHAAGRPLGTVRVCGSERLRGGAPWPFLFVVAAAGASLWAASGFIARRLTRPLGELVRVANEIGAGSLEARVTLRRSRYGEIGILADAINDMAARIQKQMSDQRELLAVVSHEIRSPLARMRVALELARDSSDRQGTLEKLDGMERELVEINELTGKLLASARLDFSALEWRELDARAITLAVIQRLGLPEAILQCDEDVKLSGDPTLIARALSNLLENAIEYGNGPTLVRVSASDAAIEFAVQDLGPGFDASELPSVFESFVRGNAATGPGSLGLGLALVRRIALSHRGRVWAENRTPAGAEVGFSIGR
jgi:signal transduction histidine kinase